ncbi:MAG TPA: hypothetical protein VFP72_14505 [Kineosporiaceae bacterium]|nr:hypothetical protein [Kineosporiaceae bacterium]
MTTFKRIAVARKEHPCVNCTAGVQPGHTYSRHTVTPRDEDGGNSSDRIVSLTGHHPYGTCKEQAETGRWITPQERADTWNAVHPAGTRVIYWPVGPVGDSRYRAERIETTTCTAAAPYTDTVSGIFLAGISGWVNLAHVVPDITIDVWRSAPDHQRDSCDCGDGHGCSHGDWCNTCLTAFEDAGKTFRPWQIDWPCPPTLASLGITSARVWWEVEGTLWERLHLECTARDVREWNATYPIGTPVRSRNGCPSGDGVTTSLAYLSPDGMDAFVDVNGRRRLITYLQPARTLEPAHA